LPPCSSLHGEEESTMRVRIVVADQAEARFYDITPPASELRPCGSLSDEAAHLHDRELVSDRPGRVFDHAAAPGARRGAVAHHSTGGERHPRKHEAQNFAHRIAQRLETDERSGSFDRMVVIAGPPFLGTLRAALPQALRGKLAAEVPKDLVHVDLEQLRRHLPREMLK
jgi:protein required for attachment to host cells